MGSLSHLLIRLLPDVEGGEEGKARALGVHTTRSSTNFALFGLHIGLELGTWA